MGLLWERVGEGLINVKIYKFLPWMRFCISLDISKEDIKALDLQGGIAKNIQHPQSRLLKFTRKASGTTPELEVVVDRFDLGYHVIVNSIPYDKEYHRNTTSPLSKKKKLLDR